MIEVQSSSALATVQDLGRQGAVHGVIREQIRERFCVGQVIDRDDFEVFVAHRRAKYVASDTSKSIDSDTNGHGVFLYRQMC